MKFDSYLKLYVKINSKWIEDLNLRPETINLPEKKIQGKSSSALALAMIFWT